MTHREEELVERLRKAYQVIQDMLAYAPDYMHSIPKKEYQKAVTRAVQRLDDEVGKPKGFGAVTLKQILEDSPRDDLDLL
jgi:hypothetical protein